MAIPTDTEILDWLDSENPNERLLRVTNVGLTLDANRGTGVRAFIKGRLAAAARDREFTGRPPELKLAGIGFEAYEGTVWLNCDEAGSEQASREQIRGLQEWLDQAAHYLDWVDTEDLP